MDNLIKMVVDKTGISAEQAKGAVDTVLGFIKEKVPGIGDQIDGLLKGETGDVVKNISGKLGF
ncbi:MAG: DUF2267 domain-containing protein [Ignavibacteriae bacterium]|nr:MAG: DUF2267 domain-containing protein [Ignavibacteriota bacterium]